MNTKYITCTVFHPGKEGYVTVDIKIKCSENESREKSKICKVIATISDAFLENNLSMGFSEDVEISNKYSHCDYFGTVDEIIFRILSES